MTDFGEIPNRSQSNAFTNLEFPENRCSDSHTSSKGVNETALFYIFYARLLIKFDIGAVSKTMSGESELRKNRRSEDHALIMGVDTLLPYFRHLLPNVGEVQNKRLHIEVFTIRVS